jgi:uncharacterized protein (DUF1499 family)
MYNSIKAMKTMSNKKVLTIGGGLAVVGALGFVGYANRRLFLVNDVTTGESDAYPDLRSRVYYADAGKVLEAAEQAIRSLPRWRLLVSDTDNDTVDAEVETPIGGFLDDVSVYATEIGHSQTRVVIRSRSRQSGGDLGQNALHIRELQDAMDDRLQSESAI